MKRCFNTQEALDYLGVRRRFFAEHLVPLLEGKGVRAGTSIVYERTDLDAAWDRYKLGAGNGRASQGEKTWDAPESKAVSTRGRTARMTLIPPTGGSAFAAAVSNLIAKRKTS